MLCEEAASVEPGGSELPQFADHIFLKLVVELCSAAPVFDQVPSVHTLVDQGQREHGRWGSW